MLACSLTMRVSGLVSGTVPFCSNELYHLAVSLGGGIPSLACNSLNYLLTPRCFGRSSRVNQLVK